MSEETATVQPQKIENVQSIRILESILFASDDILTPARIKQILPDKPDAHAIRKMVAQLNIQLQEQRHPFEVVEVAGGFQFRTVAYYQPWVAQLFKDRASKKLSVQALECLAIIAYKQPLSKAEIESVRGVISDGAMKTLLERHFVTIIGRSDKPGRPLLYGTTEEFLRYFGINRLADLPKIEEFETLAKSKLEELSQEELGQLGFSGPEVSGEVDGAAGGQPEGVEGLLSVVERAPGGDTGTPLSDESSRREIHPITDQTVIDDSLIVDPGELGVVEDPGADSRTAEDPQS